MPINLLASFQYNTAEFMHKPMPAANKINNNDAMSNPSKSCGHTSKPSHAITLKMMIYTTKNVANSIIKRVSIGSMGLTCRYANSAVFDEMPFESCVLVLLKALNGITPEIKNNATGTPAKLLRPIIVNNIARIEACAAGSTMAQKYPRREDPKRVFSSRISNAWTVSRIIWSDVRFGISNLLEELQYSRNLIQFILNNNLFDMGCTH